jgi:parallel beta-helix repeat protein
MIRGEKMKFKFNKKRYAFLICLVLVFLSFLTTFAQSSSNNGNLEEELLILQNDLESAGYGWLIDYDINYPQVEVYEAYGNEILMTFDISSDGEYKKYLTSLSGEQDTFDLLVKNGDVEFDYIVDPTYPQNGTTVYDCGIINESGTYTLNQSIDNREGTCIEIQADYVVLDGDGFYIDGNDIGYGIGIKVEGYNHSVIKNFANVTGFYYGITLTSNYNNTINDVNTSYNTIGIDLSNSGDNNIYNIVSDFNSYNGLDIGEGSNYNQFSDISARNNDAIGLSVDSSSGNIFSNIETNYNNYGAYINIGTNNTFTNLNSSLNTLGIQIISSSNNTFTNITANSNEGDGIYMATGSDNNEFINVDTISNANDGIDFYLNSNNTVYNLNSSFNGNFLTGFTGVNMLSESNTTFYNLTSSSNGAQGIYLQACINNSFINLDSYNNSNEEIYAWDWDLEGGSMDNRLIYDNELGSIEFNPINRSVECNIIFSDQEGAGNVTISENSLFVDSESCPDMNMPAIGTIKTNPSSGGLQKVIFIGDEVCFDCNTTSLDQENAIVRIPHWTYVAAGGIIDNCSVFINDSTNGINKFYIYPNRIPRNDNNATCITILNRSSTLNQVNLYGNNSVVDGIDASGSIGILVNAPGTLVTLSGINVSDYEYGIYLNSSSSRTLLNITAYSNTYGLYFNNVSHRIIRGLYAYDNEYGTYIFGGSNNTFINSTFDSNTDTGLYIFNSSNSTLYNITAYNNQYGILLNSSLYNNFTLINTSLNSLYGLFLDSSPNNIINGSALSNSVEDMHCVNSTIDLTQSMEYSIQSGCDGTIALTSCGTLNIAGQTYKLQDNIDNYAGTCFTISADNITLDGNGYYIDGDDLGADHGIYASVRRNITIKNFANISDFGALEGQGIYLASTNNSFLYNNTLNSNLNGIRLSFGSNNNTLYDNNVNSNTDYGLYLSSSSNNNQLLDNTANSNTQGIYIASSSNNNQLLDNTANSNNNYGIIFSSSSNNTLTNNTANSNNIGVSLSSSSNNNQLLDNTANSNTEYGIYLLSSSSNNTLTNNTANFNYFGIYLSSSSNNTIMNNTANSNYAGIPLDGNSNYNTITNNNVSSNTNGVHLQSSSNNTIMNNDVSSNTNGVHLQSSSRYNAITNNTVNSNTRGIYFIDSSNNAITNNTVNSNTIGVLITLSISSSLNNNFTNGMINASKQHAIYMNGLPQSGNSFTNVSITNTNVSYRDVFFNTASINDTEFIDMPYIGNYSFTGVGGTVIVENSLYGKIKFLSAVNGSGTNFTSDIQIGNNSVFVNSSSNSGLNKSANVTLYGIGNRGYTNPRIFKDNALCTDCYNFTALTASIVIFNVSGAGEYEIADGDMIPITSCGVISSSGGYLLQNDIYGENPCIIVNADDVIIDGNSKKIGVQGDIGTGVLINSSDNVVLSNLLVNYYTTCVNVSDSSNFRIDSGTTIMACTDGIILENSDNGVIADSSIKDNEVSSLKISGTSEGNIIVNNEFSRVSSPNLKSIIDETSNSLYNYLVYNNSNGEIKWIDSRFLGNMTVNGDIELGTSVIIDDNEIGIASGYFTTEVERIDSTGVNMTLYNVPAYTSFNGKFKINLFGIREDGLRCKHCVNFTNVLAGGTVIFNASNANALYAVGLAPNSKSTVPLGKGWNLFGLVTDDNYSEGANVTITLQPGRNYIGYSGYANISKDSVYVTLSDGTILNWGQSIQLFKAYNLFGYYDSSQGNKKFKYAGLDDDTLRVGKGYIIDVNDNVTSGGVSDYINITFVGAGGSRTDDSYAWADLMFMNESSGEVLNVTEASNSTNRWVISRIERRVAGPVDDNVYNYICSGFGCNAQSLSSWEGYQIYNYKEGISLLRQD